MRVNAHPRLPLDSVVLQPDAGPRCLVLVHGYGEPSTDLTDRLSLIDPDRRFVVVVPTAPIEWRGRRIWHRPLSDPEAAARQYVESLAALDELLGSIGDELHIGPADTIVGGFSQGGGMAIGLLVGADVVHRPAAGFGVCSFPPMVPGLRVDPAAAAGRPYFLSSAHEDHFAPIELSRHGAVALRRLGLDLTYVEADGPHVMTDLAATQIGAWLTRLDDPTAPGVTGRSHGADLLDAAAADGSSEGGWHRAWELV